MSLDDWQADQHRQRRNRRIEIAQQWLAEETNWRDIGQMAHRIGAAQAIVRSLLEELGADQ